MILSDNRYAADSLKHKDVPLKHGGYSQAKDMVSSLSKDAKYKAIIFDYDGTLYDFRSLARHLLCCSPRDAFRMLAERKARRAMLGSDMGSMACLRSELFRRMSVITGKSADMLGEWYVEKYLPLLLKVLKKYYKARKNADCLLESLRVMGIKTAVLSDYPYIQDRLEAIGLDSNLFDATLSAEEMGALKPSARPFIEAAKVLGVPPNGCLVVGDRSDTDGDGARAAGMDFVRIERHGCKKGEDSDNPIPWDDFSRYALLSVE